MIKVDWKLYQIVQEAFDSKEWLVGEEWVCGDEWTEHLNSIGASVEFVSGEITPIGPQGHFDVMMDVLSFISAGGDTLNDNELHNYTACPNPRCHKQSSIIYMPNKLAEKIVVLGHMPNSLCETN